MNRREEVGNEILGIDSPYILCELPTSFGKTKIALDVMSERCNKDSKILIVVPKVVLKSNWRDEFIKWGYEEYINSVVFVTYVSFPKVAGKYDLVIFDECHHLSARCQDALDDFIIDNCILLSATVSKDIRMRLKVLFPSLATYKVRIKEATEDGILPDPRVYLIPLSLDDYYANQLIVKNKSKGNPITIPYSKRWSYHGVKNREVNIRCTQQQYYDDMSSLIYWYKKRMFNEVFKNMFLRKSGDRLKWLSDQKTTYIKSLLDQLHQERTLTFCNGIPQTEELGKYCINSKNKKSMDYLDKFNDGKINHITACNMLDEGVNLFNCRIGIYGVLNSSDRMIKQKLGRLLRHPDPIIIIPYYRGTRDEELVNKMCEDYNPELVRTITSLTELKL